MFPTAAEEAEFQMHWAFTGSTPQALFHYTGNEGLLGIIGTTSFWATDAKFLNDRQEVAGAISTVWQLVKEWFQDNELPFAAKLGNKILSWMTVNQSPHYIFSLSRNGDSLSQWRGYSGQGAGYAIGFKYDALQAWCNAERYTLSQVIYDTKVYRDCLLTIGAAYIADLSTYFPKFGRGQINADVLESYAKRFANIALRYAPFVKHNGFSDEREWRIVKAFTPKLGDSSTIRFRSGRHSLIPYCTLEFEAKAFFQAIDQINIKFSEHAELCDEAL